MYVAWGDTNYTSGDEFSCPASYWPDWGMAACKVGGQWGIDTNDYRTFWYVAPSDTNSDCLRMEVDRTILSSNLVLDLSFFDYTNSAMYLDLCDTNGNVLATDPYGNLMSGLGQASSVTIDIPLQQYPDAAEIVLRRDSGEMTIYESLLSINADNIGITDSQDQGGSADSSSSVGMSAGISMSSMGGAGQFSGNQSFSMDSMMQQNSGSTSFSNWNYAICIWFPGYTVSETLTNFPVLIELNTGITNFLYSQLASANGYDLRFSDSTQTTELNYEFGLWNTNGTSYIWVQVPALTSNTSIWAYWGNSNALQQAYTANGSTWDGNFALVEHMNDGSGTTVHDSTANGYTASTHESCSWVNSSISGGGVNLTTSDGKNGIEMNSGNPSVGSSWTVSAWVMNLYGTGSKVLFEGQGDDVDQHVEVDSSSKIGIYRGGDWGQTTPTDTGATLISASCSNQWEEFTAVGTGGQTYMYINGTYVGKCSKQPSASVRCIGYRDRQTGYDWGWQFAYYLDEARVETTARSSNWVWATYLTMSSNSVFTSFGEIQGANPGFPVVDPSTSNITTTSATLIGNLISTGGSATTVFIYWGTTDGVTNQGSWANITNLGVQSVGLVSCELTGLTPDTTYYYRFNVTNANGASWDTRSSSFKTLLDMSQYQFKISVGFPGCTQSETLTNFPALIVLNTNISNFAYNQFISSNGCDLRFSDSGHAIELNYEIEQWNTNGNSYVWVQIPSLTSNTQIWAYWGNTNTSVISSPAVYTTNGSTWDSNFAGVWHMSEASASANAMDSTSNHNDGALSGGNAISFNGTVDGARGGMAASQVFSNGNVNLSNTAFTLSAWCYPTNSSSFGGTVDMFGGGDLGCGFGWGAGNCYAQFSEAAGDNCTTALGYVIDLNTWHYYAYRMSASSVKSIYRDGVILTLQTPSANAGFYLSKGLVIGAGGHLASWQGALDEVRAETTARSSNWIWACYMNMASNSVFNSYSGTIYTDSDGNGLPDWWELKYFGAIGQDPNSDPDGSGFPLIYDYIYGINPTNAAAKPSGTRFVSTTGLNIFPYTNWATAATSINAALAAATNDYEIVMVADGVYSGDTNNNIWFPPYPVMLTSTGNPANCIIDGGGTNWGFTFADSQDLDSVLNGFTIRNMYVYPVGGDGPAIFCDASPTIENCIITQNNAGGGFPGGAIVDIESGTHPIIRNCIISGNNAGFGGGIAVWSSDVTGRIENCTIVSNYAAFYGGGGGMYCGSTNMVVQNTIVWGNMSGTNNTPDQIFGTPLVSYCDIQGGWTNNGTGNITNDPQFVDAANGNYRLSPGSPCIDAGTNQAWMANITDLDGNPRIVNGTVDIGACEFTPPVWNISGTISYSGLQTGLIYVVAVTSSNSWATNYSQVVSSLSTQGVSGTISNDTLLSFYTGAPSQSAYSITNLPSQGNYWIKAWRDSNGNLSNDTAEANGLYPANPVYLTCNTNGINITLTDPDSDGDHLPDWVETGTHIFISPWNTGTSSTNMYSATNGIPDGVSLEEGHDPNSSDTNAPTVTITVPVNNYIKSLMP
jgi:hypothetical protein